LGGGCSFNPHPYESAKTTEGEDLKKKEGGRVAAGRKAQREEDVGSD